MYSEEESYPEDIIILPAEEIIVAEAESAVVISILGFRIEIKLRIMEILAFVWCAAAICLMLYQIMSYGLFMGRLHRESGNGNREAGKGRRLYTWSSSAVRSPFVGGIFCPVVYLPDDLEERQRELILEHEKIHLKRLDYLVKPLAMLICCVHWFNPFAWMAFYLMERDMESSCDEAVLRRIGYDRRKEYANTLLGMAERDGWKPGRLIAFGENQVKSRIRRTVKLNQTKRGTVAFGIAVTCMAAVLLLVSRPATQSGQEAAEINALADALELPVTPDASELSEEPEQANQPEDLEQSEPADEETGQSGKRDSEAAVTGVPGTDSNTVTEFVPLEEMFSSEETAHEESGGGMQITNYVPSRDQFENILLTTDGVVDEVEILYGYPVEAPDISNDFGTRIHPVTQEEIFHSGVDFAADAGSAVMAAADGKVVKTGYDAENGNYIIVQHINGDMTYYAMCETIVASEGDEVKRGEQIATVGSTGKSTGPHLHFAVSRDGSYIEPHFAESVKE